ncbi:hypothetical protein Poli38472_004613 [Pythium oligandrum]|uniref:Sterol 3-beta-glucosyltransferase n=1 Tax=Pythium oligandrum TaxID=41045 RepID=A0A8K1CA48_PYTOL|nr:hypothetical protein Poli38472_004613 [Pythium oligandrum]|eukprot:TMW59544.1 hypothetical protein Poli38472_004613 [Pythium oligandrum]
MENTKPVKKLNPKLARAFDAIKAERTRMRLGSFADVVHAVAAFDKEGHINLAFDEDDDKYDITAMQQHDKQVQKYEATQQSVPGEVVPQLNVCIMIVGTRGDVQPFIGIAKRLQQDGHRVRLATHAVYRDFVMEHGVEFYPLGGDPKELAAYMVKTGGHIIPLKLDTLLKDVPRNVQMIDEILNSTWPAVSAADPDGNGKGVPGKPFVANAIISNPVTYGHIHVAERLGVPLHIMFPQPWVPTTAFPHPMSNLPYDDKPQKKNYLSYKMVDLLMWQGTESMVNRFRKDVLGLRKIRKGDGGRDILLDLAIPHAFMWSSALVPKPADWGNIYDVIGTVLLKGVGSSYNPAPELEAFLGNDGGPIFVGFGSMILSDPVGTTKMIIEAAKLANVRVLIQSSWSDMASGIDVPDNIFFLGNCPHDWLMPRVSAVVHHGGAGTTAAGLLAGKPTFIVPFFGDQPFWGRAVVKAGVGVEPCPIVDLTVEKLRAAFEKLTDPEVKKRAEQLCEVMTKEDGVEEAVKSFYRHLPLKAMRCDIDGKQLATKWSTKDKIKMCDECEYVITSRVENSTDDIVEYHCVDYSARGPESVLEGAASGAGALLHELGSGVKDIFIKPAQGYREEGAKGAVLGFAKGLVSGVLIRPIQGAALLADHVATGRYNQSRAPEDRKKGTVFFDSCGALGTNAPDAHTVSMKDDETSGSDKPRMDRDRVSIQMGVEERQKLEARFHEIMKQRESEGDETINIVNYSPDSSRGSIESTSVLRRSSCGSSEEILSDPDLATLQEFADVENELQALKLTSIEGRPMPKMSICLLASGTWSDNVQQFVAIGLRLKADGHRVRLATHENFRKRVLSAGLEFFAIGGHASTIGRYLLHEFGRENEKRGLFGLRKPKQDFPGEADLKELVFSLWPACVEVDALSPGLHFRADVIISHPLMFGQTIVAERLGVPLQCISSTPWSRTQAFAHTLSASIKLHKPYQYSRSNLASYDAVDNVHWGGIRDVLDEFRSSLGLSHKTKGNNLLSLWRTPHTYLWNEKLLPKPMDWGNEITVAGYVEWHEPSAVHEDAATQAFAVESSTPLVYVGLDQGDWENHRLEKFVEYIEKAAEESNSRILLQLVGGTPSVSPRRTSVLMEISPEVPIKSILPFVAGAIHWGDSSVTATFASAGIPACVVTHNATQRLWGKALSLSGAGVDPLDLTSVSAKSMSDVLLSKESLAHVIQSLLSPAIKSAAQEVSTTFSSEAAVEKAVKAIYANLPLEGMTCDLDPTRVARIYDQANELKLSYEAQFVVQMLTDPDDKTDLKYKPLKYSQKRPPRFTLRQLDAKPSKSNDSDGEKTPRFSYEIKAYRRASNAAPSVLQKAKLGRQMSMAEHVFEAPKSWATPDAKESRVAEINAASVSRSDPTQILPTCLQLAGEI